MSDKEDKARQLAAQIAVRASLEKIVGSWGEMELYDWLQCMGYSWDGESWRKSS